MSKESIRFREGVLYSMGFVMILWFVKSLEMLMSIELGFLGILPRNLYGTIGIITSPLIHGDVMHLISNSFPLILLGIGVIYFYNKIAKIVFIWIYLMTGIWVWIVAREAYHIGASGIVYGLVSFLFFSGLFR
ncbi:MAG: rhomboid family intramembrane serine protease, partial [Bacteroidota bacterium]|nr:rhomboid family intramembrane serine protease [Bacteroidota bacterium]